MDAAAPSVVELDERACRDLLGRAVVGRVVVTDGALPLALPVNYAISRGRIVFFTGRGTKLDAAVRNAVIGFEVDDVDPARRRGWSVMAVGKAGEVTDPGWRREVESAGLEPWTGRSGHDHLVALEPTLLSGRRIEP